MKRIQHLLPLFILLVVSLSSCGQSDDTPSGKADFTHLGSLSVVIGEQSYPVLANGLIDLSGAKNVTLTGSGYNTNTHVAELTYSIIHPTPVVCTVKTTAQDLVIKTTTEMNGDQQIQSFQIEKTNVLGTIIYRFKQKKAQG